MQINKISQSAISSFKSNVHNAQSIQQNGANSDEQLKIALDALASINSIVTRAIENMKGSGLLANTEYAKSERPDIKPDLVNKIINNVIYAKSMQNEIAQKILKEYKEVDDIIRKTSSFLPEETKNKLLSCASDSGKEVELNGIKYFVSKNTLGEVTIDILDNNTAVKYNSKGKMVSIRQDDNEIKFKGKGTINRNIIRLKGISTMGIDEVFQFDEYCKRYSYYENYKPASAKHKETCTQGFCFEKSDADTLNLCHYLDKDMNIKVKDGYAIVNSSGVRSGFGVDAEGYISVDIQSGKAKYYEQIQKGSYGGRYSEHEYASFNLN